MATEWQDTNTVETVSETVRARVQADPWFAQLIAEHVPTAQALSRLGTRLLRDGLVDQALSMFRSGAVLAPEDPLLWAQCGLAYDRLGKPADAAECLERSLALSPRQADNWLLLSGIRKKMGLLAGAEMACREALTHAPASALGWQCLGLVQQDRGDFAGAIASLSACVRHGGATAPLLATLGRLCYQTGRILESHEACRVAAALVPAGSDGNEAKNMLRHTCFLKDLLEGKFVDDALATYQSSGSPAAGPQSENLADLFNAAYAMLSGFGYTEAATRLARKRCELWPESASAAYLLGAIAGEPGLDRAPPAYVAEYFDGFADRFDAKLVDALGYDVPAKIAAAVRAATPPGRLYDALDAGCGTGLCGPWMRELSRELTGVDLSPKMLQQAGKRGAYDRLLCEDLVALLARSAGQFDLAVAADVLIYLGDLGPLFAAAAKALRPGGLFAFSTERMEGDGYRLGQSGRFAHAAEYVRRSAGPAFIELSSAETTIRMEAVKPVRGDLFLLRRK